jgi:putative hydrolase of the HAD superfamily
MAKVSLLLWDVGGVLLSNAWDHTARAAAAVQFGLDAVELERRHALVDADFEAGRLDWQEYLSATVFYVPRSFSPEAFLEFMRGRSTPYPAALATARALRERGDYVMATLNNESRELNQFRIRAFRLKEIFEIFLSSCTTGRLKPDPEAYRYALQLTQCDPEESLLLDDRLENVEAAAQLGLRTVWVRDPERVREELARAGVVAG